MTKAFFAGCAVAALTIGGAVHSMGMARSVWNGVYTTGQAQRGKALYAKQCAACHGAALEGTAAAPALAGKTFLYTWSGLSVADLADRIHTTMPADNPGSLSPKAVSDITAYIMATNKFPAGKAELPANTHILKTIDITTKR